MSEEEAMDSLSPEDQLLCKHRKEKKDLQAQIQQLKKSSNKDKKKKKEAQEEIGRLEAELKDRQAQELASLKAGTEEGISDVSNGIDSLSVMEAEEAASNTPTEDQDQQEAQDPGRRVSKAERRRQKKSEANREREARIKAEEANRKHSARTVEADKLKKRLRERNLKMHDIQPDGNCMYAAIAHQLEEGVTVAGLRTQASQFILANQQDFAPFMTDPTTGEQMTHEQFTDYCHRVQTTPLWGGQPELRALSQAMKRKIEVLQAEGTPVVFGEEWTDKKPVLLAYYRHYYGLGEHYNSVMLLAADTQNECR